MENGNKKRQAVRWIIILAAIVLILFGVYRLAGVLEKKLYPEHADINIYEQTKAKKQEQRTEKFSIDDQWYTKKENITATLMLGIDDSDTSKAIDGYGNKGAADLMTLVVLDVKEKAVSVVQLNPNTMTEIPVLSTEGKHTGMTYARLSEAYNYGSTLEDGCENLKNAVSELLYGVNIDGYIAYTMNDIAALSDVVDRITIKLGEDLSYIRPEWTKGGSITLQGDAAKDWLMKRDAEHDPNDMNRMKRQQVYMATLVQKMIHMPAVTFAERVVASGISYKSSYTDQYILTFLNDCASYQNMNLISLPETFEGNQYHPDAAETERTVKELFYNRLLANES